MIVPQLFKDPAPGRASAHDLRAGKIHIVASYRPVLPPFTIKALSNAQLETIVYAGQSFERDLPGRYQSSNNDLALEEHAEGHVYRAGYFLGDGTGRERTSGGRYPHGQWEPRPSLAPVGLQDLTLIEDAKRDWIALGGLGLDIQS